jgi:serpin B
MIRQFRFLLLIPLAAALASCGDSLAPIEELPRQLTTAELKLVDADNRFAFKLFREVNAQEERGKNVFISPLSVGMALGMTYNGAAGATRDSMRATLELGDMTLQEINEAYRSFIALLRNLDPRVDFTLANSIWYRQGVPVLPDFLDRNEQYFDAEVNPLDFSDGGAADVINAWVYEQTNGKIEEIVDPPIHPLTFMFLINAVYFNADWTYQFDKDLTRDASFTLSDGSQTTVPMMALAEEIPVRVYRGDEQTVVDLFYGGQAYSMTIVVPDDPAAIDDLAENLTESQWNSWVLGLDSTETFVTMPKFTLEYEIELNDVLKALGMEIAFTGAADFSDMVDGGGAYIEKVRHKTFVDVHEEGTEAAAVTSVEMRFTGMPSTVHVDRPFVFAIRENYSGSILFIGKILDPS